MTASLPPDYCGFIALIGRPNVGKSTLLNQLLTQKISITSKKPQTTRHCILGINTKGNYQSVYIDTPGLHIKEKKAINRLMNRAATSSLGNVDLIIFMTEGTYWTPDDEMILKKLHNKAIPVVLAINKVDQIKNKQVLLPFMQNMAKRYYFHEIILISAKRGDQVTTLEHIVTKALPQSPHHFPEDYITDRSSRFMATEIIREKLIRFTGQELPYATTVMIEQFSVDKNNEIFNISALILVERNNQKRIIIGHRGMRLKVIGQEARKDMERLFDKRVFLQLWIKVKSGWADNAKILQGLGYGDK